MSLMQLAMVGLGRMGLNMTRRLLRHGHEVVVFNRTAEKVTAATGEGATPSTSLPDLIGKLGTPRIVWIMVPSGDATEEVIDSLESLLSKGDIVIDGGNSKWKDSIEHSERLSKKGIQFLDCGTSGGIWGLENGYCLMVGGPKEAFDHVEPILRDLAAGDGFAYVGPAGSGHFVKMVHNGIEYGLLEAYGEGFEILSKSEYDLDLYAIASLWNRGSVVRSWLLELAESAFGEDPKLEGIEGYVEDSGEGRWTVQAAIHENVPAPVIAAALFARFYSRQDESFGAKVIAALRNQFGGHSVKQAVQGHSTGKQG